MLENNKIRYNTDTTGFFVITINIPDKTDIKDIIYKKTDSKP